MKVISVNVGLPQRHLWHGNEVLTSIFKSPVNGPVMVYRLNLEGDRQSDLENHGGRNKAVYAYPAEHYELWRSELPGAELPWGAFGENLTIEGIREDDTFVGDHFRAGKALLMVTQPRIPCYKLNLRLNRDDMIKRFLSSNRSGVYFSVLEEGDIAAGDAVDRIQIDKDRISVAEINRAVTDSEANVSVMQRAVQHKVLPSGLRDHFLGQLASSGK